MVPEAPLERSDAGLAPVADGWFVLNAREARWHDGPYGAYTAFEGDGRFPSLGINISVLQSGQALGMYHGEDQQEDFVLLSGEGVLLIEGQERPLKRWDFVHCPPWTEHIILGAGEEGCTVLAVGARPNKGLLYPRSELALAHGAGVGRETRDADEAYADAAEYRTVSFRPGWL